MRDLQLSGPAHPKAGTPHDVLHRTIEDYHDKRHTGAYAECWGCTEVHLFFQDHPALVAKL